MSLTEIKSLEVRTVNTNYHSLNAHLLTMGANWIARNV
jgi:hypothetical protein